MPHDELTLLPILKTKEENQDKCLESYLENIDVQAKRGKGLTGKGIVVAVLDTGCDIEHPDLQGKITCHYNFTNEDGGNIQMVRDKHGHGTIVANIVAGEGSQYNVPGVAPNVKLVILKVLNSSGKGSVDSLIEAIHYAVDWQGSAGEKISVMVISPGCREYNRDLHSAVKRAKKENIVIITASDTKKDINSKTRYPDNFDEVISVAAWREKYSIASLETTKDTDLFVLNGDTLTTDYDGTLTSVISGAFPAYQAAGAIALLIEEYMCLVNESPTVNAIYKMIQNHTEKYDYGYNIVPVLNLSHQCANDKSLMHENINRLLSCLQEAKENRSLLLKGLDHFSSQEEKSLMYDLINDTANIAQRIRNFYGKNAH